MPGRIGGLLHRLHGVEAGVVVGLAGDDHADVLRIHWEGWLLGRREQLGGVAADELVRGVGEDPGEIGVIGVFHGLVELDPEESSPGLGG